MRTNVGFLLCFFIVLGVSASAQRVNVSTSIRHLELLYRDSTKKERELLAPDKEDQERFAAFLKRPDTGLIRLVEDKGCSDSTAVISARSTCGEFSMPGAGSSYSFRTGDYRIPRLADITFTEDSFQSMGNLVHAVFVNLGDAPIESVTLDSKGMAFITGLKPETNYLKARDLGARLVKGVEADGYKYRRGVRALESSTYALRSIAYDGRFNRAVPGLAYNEFDYDKRLDVVIAFRVIRRHQDGSVTLLWKQLSKQKSPKMKPVKQAAMPEAKNEFGK